MYSKVFEDMSEEKFSYFGCIDGFGAWNDDYPLHKAVVDHDQNGIHPAHFREIGNKVHGELFKRKGHRGSDGVQWCYVSRQTYVEVNDTYSEGGTHKEMLRPQSKAKVMNKRRGDKVTIRRIADS